MDDVYGEQSDATERLERHRVRWLFNGFPLYGDEYNETDAAVVVGHISEPQWTYADLQPADIAALHAAANRLSQSAALVSDENWWTPQRCFRAALEWYGVLCWHPVDQRRDVRENGVYTTFTCDQCGDMLTRKLETCPLCRGRGEAFVFDPPVIDILRVSESDILDVSQPRWAECPCCHGRRVC